MLRNIRFVIYPGFDLLDLAGPLAAFTDAAEIAAGAYAIEIVSATPSPVISSSSVPVFCKAPSRRSVDTIVVMGGPPPTGRRPVENTVRLIERSSERVRRIASVCTGAFILGYAGLLEGKGVTTHWRYAAELQSRFPSARVDADKIFIHDGAIWTSAGVTAGIDLALALIEEDLSLSISRQVARGLVVYQRRLGGQSQYSAMLELEPPSDRIRQALAFARNHLHEPLPVARLAEIAHLSARQFSRAFVAETGVSPAKAVERLRAEAARPLVEDGRKPFDIIARSVGFSDPERMRQAFVKSFGHSPQSLRRQGRKL